jgi:uncharacterized repeat protein (TIGR01451 family)
MKKISRTILVLLSLFLAGFLSHEVTFDWVRAAGAIYVANSGSDSHDCLSPSTPCATINAAIGKATAGDTIFIATGTYSKSVTSEVVYLNKSVDLSGGWDTDFTQQTGKSAVDGRGIQRGLTVMTATVTVDHMIFQNGGNIFEGGGIYNKGKLSLMNSEIIHNTTTYMSGGIVNYASLTLIDSLVMDNIANKYGGGILNNGGTITITNSTLSNNEIIETYSSAGSAIENRGTLIVSNSTISGNRGQFAIYNFFGNASFNNVTVTQNDNGILGSYGGTITFRNSIISSNGSWDCMAYQTTVSSLGYNIIQKQDQCTLGSNDLSVDPKLTSLANNGGATLTIALMVNSPAINAGNPDGCLDSAGNPLLTDQRGAPRMGRCDIGAFEAGLSLNKKVSGSLYRGGQALYQLTLQNIAHNTDLSNVQLTDTLPSNLAFITSTLQTNNGIATMDGDKLSWFGTVLSDTTTIIQFKTAISETVPLDTWITNTAISSWEGLLSTSQIGFNTLPHIFLPFCLQYSCSSHLFDDFSNPQSGWPISESSFFKSEYLNGEYRIYGKTRGYIYLVRSPWCNKQSYTIELDIHGDGQSGNSYGLLFGINSDFSQYYLLDITPYNQGAGWYRRDPGGFSKIILTSQLHNILPGNGTNHLIVIRNGNRMEILINGQGFYTYEDSTITGPTGVGIAASYGNLQLIRADAYFDNIRLTALDPLNSASQPPSMFGKQVIESPIFQMNSVITTTTKNSFPK